MIIMTRACWKNLIRMTATTAVIFFGRMTANGMAAAAESSLSLQDDHHVADEVLSSSLRVDAVYTYGAPSISNPHISNPGNKCIPGLRMYTQDEQQQQQNKCQWWEWWCSDNNNDSSFSSSGSSEEQRIITNTDFASHWNANKFPHPKMSTLALVWNVDSQVVEYLFMECTDDDDDEIVDEYDFQWWPHHSQTANMVNHIHSLEWHYERRLQQIPKHVRGPSLEYAAIANCGYETSAQEVIDCHANYVTRGNGLPGMDTSVWKVAAFMNHQYGNNGDNDPVVVYEKTQDEDDNNDVDNNNNFKTCIISFAGSESIGDWGDFLPWNSGTTGYCGRHGVHIGVRNELWSITHDDQWTNVIKPQLETCHEVTCVGHSLGGALCNVFTMCANQGEENLDELDDAGMWDDFEALAWTKAKSPLVRGR
jgi:hypothetical protein